MLRALVALALLTSVASAEDEDPKAAIASRGIVLKAGKRHLVVIVPAAEKRKYDDPTSKLFNATYYFGDSKTLFTQPAGSWKNDGTDAERIEFDDPRALFEAKLVRSGDSFTVHCSDWDDSAESRRAIELEPADAKTAELAAKIPIKPLGIAYYAYLLARIPGTTEYLYVDRGRGADHQTFRVFMGKRGAMKKLVVKEVAVDSTAIVLVTSKGSLNISEPTTKDAKQTATFGSTKKRKTLEIIPTYPNRELIYKELGVYTRDRTGFLCDEL